MNTNNQGSAGTPLQGQHESRIDPKAIKIFSPSLEEINPQDAPEGQQVSQSAVAADCKALAGPEKGGEGGVPAPASPPLEAAVRAAPMPATNTEFLSAIFPSVEEGEVIAICSKPGDPEVGQWFAKVADNVDQDCPKSANNYYNCATFRPHPAEGLRATKAQAGHYSVLVLDDVGTKVPLSAVEALPPTYAIETSPGNCQFGYVLASPMSDQNEVAALQQAISAAGLCDAGALGIARWARLPFAINGKPKYRQAGQPFRCRLHLWAPERRFTVTELHDAFALSTSIPKTRSMPKKCPVSVELPANLSHEVYRPAKLENPVVTALKSRGLYKSEPQAGTHEITCPWVEEHTDQIDGGTAYFEPSPAYPTGGFKCHHSHGDQLSISDLLEQLEVNPQDARNESEIRYVQGSIDKVVRAAEYVLSQTRKFFQSGGAIVIIKPNGQSSDVRMQLATQPELTLALSEATTFMSWDRNKGAWRPCDPPEKVVKLLHGAPQYFYLPRLNGIARQPYYRPGEGSLVTVAGYDQQSAMYGAFDGSGINVGPPTREAAEAALSKLNDLLAEFVFESPVDRSAALSAMMTAAVRPYLNVAPAYLTSAPESGVGKSYLNRVITGFAGGEPARASFPQSADEATKSVLSLLLTAPSCIEYDDMVSDFKAHAIMNRMLTSESITDRILGVSKAATVSTRTLIIGSGINVVPVKDMSRRVITIRLASVPENRIGRKFNGSPDEAVRTKRMDYVSAVLTIIEAWKAAGKPKGDAASLASYGDHWADHCRHPLIWLGLQDPARSIFDQVDQDSDSEDLGTFLQEWAKVFGNKAVAVRKVIKTAHDDPDGSLCEILYDLPVCDGSRVSPTSLGLFLKKNTKRIVGGLRLIADRADGRRGWRVERVPSQGPEVPTE